MSEAYNELLTKAARRIYELSGDGGASFDQLSGIKHRRYMAQAQAAFNIFVRNNEAVGSWMAAALDDPEVCDEMKRDINQWFEGHDGAVS